jgi:proline iminopeptidase
MRLLLVRGAAWLAATALVPLGVGVALGVAFLLVSDVDRVAALLAAGAAAGAGVAAGCGALLGRGMGLPRRWVAGALAAVVALAFVGLVAAVAADGRPPAPAPVAADPRGTPEMWRLSTGSRVAVWQRPADVRRHRTPVVFLHGGPGMYTQASRIADGAVLRAAGFDTVYFDQAGGGASDRLPVTRYTVDRSVADVEALRQRLGAERMVLWGNSFGAQLAAAYTAAHPGRVAGLLLTSPGAFPGFPADRDYRATERDDDTELPGRVFLATLLVGFNPRLAEDFVDQAEAGAMLDDLTRRELAGGFVCKGSGDLGLGAELARERGGNLYANRLIGAELGSYRLGRSPVDVPALVVRGECDFVPRVHAERYAGFARPARIVDVAGVGHGLRGNPADVSGAVTAFATTDLAHLP